MESRGRKQRSGSNQFGSLDWELAHACFWCSLPACVLLLFANPGPTPSKQSMPTWNEVEIGSIRRRANDGVIIRFVAARRSICRIALAAGLLGGEQRGGGEWSGLEVLVERWWPPSQWHWRSWLPARCTLNEKAKSIANVILCTYWNTTHFELYLPRNSNNAAIYHCKLLKITPSVVILNNRDHTSQIGDCQAVLYILSVKCMSY